MHSRLIAAASLIVLAVYMMTIAPGLFWRDCAEFVMIPFNLDIGHPAGSPAFTMLAGFFARLPIGSIAFRSNLFSALMGALALIFFVYAARSVIRRVAPELKDPVALALSTFAVVPLLFSTGYWYWAVTAEVYTSMLGAVALAIGLTLNQTGDRTGPDLRRPTIRPTTASVRPRTPPTSTPASLPRVTTPRAMARPRRLSSRAGATTTGRTRCGRTTTTG